MFGKSVLIVLTMALTVSVGANQFSPVQLVSTVSFDEKQPPDYLWRLAEGAWGNLRSMEGLPYKQAVLAELNKPDLQKFFSSESEKEAIAVRIERKVAASIGRVATSHRLKVGVELATTEVTQEVLELIFKKRGIDEPGRSEEWSNKILAPVRACFARANHALQAKACGAKAASDIEANIGMAIAHQTARKHFRNDDIANQTASRYKNCFAGAGAQAEACALKAVRSGAETFIHGEYLKRQNEEIKGHAIDLSQPHLPALRECLATASTKADMVVCGDKLTFAAGPEIARARALNQEDIRENVPSKSLATVGESAAAAMRACLTENLTAQVRDDDGTLETLSCKHRVRKAVGHKMRDVILDPQFEENSKGQKPEDTGLTQQQLDGGKARVLQGHRTCIDKIPDDKTADRELLKCFEGSGREIAEFLGDNRFRAQLAKHLKGMSESSRQELHTRLMADYKTCLKSAGIKDLRPCALSAAHELAHKIGTTRLRADLTQAIGKNGVALDSARIAQIEAAYRQCLDSKKDFETLEVELEKCGDDLHAQGTRLVQDKARAALALPGDGPKVRALKNELINNFGRISALMPQGPAGQDQADKQADNGALPRAIADLNSMIRYSPTGADRALRQVIAEAKRPGASRDSVAEKMLSSGSFDQMIKAKAFEKVVAKLKELKGKQIPSSQVLRILTSKRNFEKILSGSVMAGLRAKMANDMALLTQSGVTKEQVKAAEDRIARAVGEILLQSKDFGRLYARDRMQAAITDEYNAEVNKQRRDFGILSIIVDITKPPMPVLPHSRQAKRAEDHFLNLLLRPVLVDNKTLDKQEIDRATKIVATHVKAALDGRNLPDSQSGRQVAGRRETGMR